MIPPPSLLHLPDFLFRWQILWAHFFKSIDIICMFCVCNSGYTTILYQPVDFLWAVTTQCLRYVNCPTRVLSFFLSICYINLHNIDTKDFDSFNIREMPVTWMFYRYTDVPNALIYAKSCDHHMHRSLLLSLIYTLYRLFWTWSCMSVDDMVAKAESPETSFFLLHCYYIIISSLQNRFYLLVLVKDNE